jgi:hypothetical protein
MPALRRIDMANKPNISPDEVTIVNRRQTVAKITQYLEQLIIDQEYTGSLKVNFFRSGLTNLQKSESIILQ